MRYNQISDFDFHLPEELIAQYPLEERSSSRLLAIDAGRQQLLHQRFTDLAAWMRAGDVLVLNNTKVIPARLLGHKASGSKVECLIERIISDDEALAQLRFSKPPHAGSQIFLADAAIIATVIGRQNDLFHLRFAGETPL